MEITLSRKSGVDLQFEAPPSKSYTHRALVAAGLAEGTSRIIRPLDAEDTRITAAALKALGVPVESKDGSITVTGTRGKFSCPGGLTLDLGNSGTTMRLMTSVALLAGVPVILTGTNRMQERPVGPLVAALNSAGGRIEYLGRPGCPPIRIDGRFNGGKIAIPGDVSSQFISSILLAAPYAEWEVDLSVSSPPASRSYLDLTVDIMETFGAGVERERYSRFRVRNDLPYTGREYRVEGDYSSASYFFAIAAACGGTVTVGNLNPDSAQGDRRFLLALEQMGCEVTYGKTGVTVTRDGDLKGITIDMSTSPDTVQTLAMVAALAKTPSWIRGIAHLRFKE
ncbi:MAG: 3-phosphoshikimate 1-carboxyvinyltransferase, partial [Methanoregulaceae archaeon]